jgi:hypothetical protein
MGTFSGGGTLFPPLETPKSLFGKPVEEGIWCSMETVDHEKTATQLDIFKVKKFMESTFPGTATARPTREGKLLILAKSNKIAENAKKATNFYNDCRIKIETVQNMNIKLGSIYGRELIDYDIEVLKKELKMQGVVDVERAMSMKEGKLIANGLHILHFERRSLPTEIVMAYLRYTVRSYYPRPLRCSKCCVFGHSRKRCGETEEACRKCDKPMHKPEKCADNSAYCRNCKEKGHDSYDDKCPKYAMELAIVRLKVDKNISFGQARAEMQKTISDATASYMNSITESIQAAARKKAQESAKIAKMIEDQIEEQLKLEKQIEQLKKLMQRNEELLETRNELLKLTEQQKTPPRSKPAPYPFTDPTTNPKTLVAAEKCADEPIIDIDMLSSSADEAMDMSTPMKRRSDSTEGNKAKKNNATLITSTTWTTLSSELQASLLELAPKTDPLHYGFTIENGKIVKRGNKTSNDINRSRKLILALKTHLTKKKSIESTDNEEEEGHP